MLCSALNDTFVQLHNAISATLQEKLAWQFGHFLRTGEEK